MHTPRRCMLRLMHPNAMQCLGDTNGILPHTLSLIHPPSRLCLEDRQKKRIKEAGEGQEDTRQFVLRTRKPNKCGSCGDYGHNKRKCQNIRIPLESAPKPKEGRPVKGTTTIRGPGTRKRKVDLVPQTSQPSNVPSTQTSQPKQAGSQGKKRGGATVTGYVTGVGEVQQCAATTDGTLVSGKRQKHGDVAVRGCANVGQKKKKRKTVAMSVLCTQPMQSQVQTSQDVSVSQAPQCNEG